MNMIISTKKISAALALAVIVGFGYGAVPAHAMTEDSTASSPTTLSPDDPSIMQQTTPMTSEDMGSTTTSDGMEVMPLSAPITDDSQAAESQPVMTTMTTDSSSENTGDDIKPVSTTQTVVTIIGLMVLAILLIGVAAYFILSRKKLPTSKIDK